LKNIYIYNKLGFIEECPEQALILPSLLNLINLSHGSSVPVAVNGRFTEGMSLISSYNFPVRLSMNRMLLKGYEGDYFKVSSKLHMRAWMN
jgi:hypothetical protein